ncbi:MAG: ATP-binding protein [Anaerolineaceae bacterium]|nr:ATP-binding protein [Anaerolineaceae bacterium]
MSQSAIRFIGRNGELELIRESLCEWGSQKIIFISGEGGVGKTRLLQEVDRRVETWDLPFACKTIPIIDFDDDQYKLPQNIGFAIGQQLGHDTFEPYFETARDLRLAQIHASLHGVRVPSRKWATANQSFTECFARASKEQRIILRIDTMDTLSETGSLAYILDMAFQLTNVLLLFAGREVDQVYQKYKSKSPSDISLIELKPFDPDECQNYLQEKQRHLQITLDINWLQKLFVLANGVPVLIDLAIEWAATHRKIDLIEEVSLSELNDLYNSSTKVDEFHNLQRHFQKAVIMPIADLKTNLDQLMFLLAKIKPLDMGDIQELLNLPLDEAQQLMIEANKSTAIKSLPDNRIKLHDEVQRLVEEFVWPTLDPSGVWEIRDSQRAIKHLVRKSEGLLDEIVKKKAENQRGFDTAKPLEVFRKTRAMEYQFWALRLQVLPRLLALNVLKGYEQFSDDFETARKEIGDTSSRFALLATISEYARLKSPKTDINGNKLDKKKRLYISRIYAREMTHNGLYGNAAEIYEVLLAETPIDTEVYLDTLRERASQLVRAGKIRQAETQVDKGLQKANDLGFFEQRIKFETDRGWIHRLSGNLDQAIHYYGQALRHAFEIDAKERIALIYSQRAYVLALQHKNREALTEIQQSIELWQVLWQQRDEYEFRLGQAWNIAGEIYIEAERPQDAISCFERSFDIFEREEGQGAEWKSKARSGRGFAYWLHANDLRKRGELSVAKQYFDYAYKDLTWACEQASDFDAPFMLNRLGEICFAQEKYVEATNAWQEALSTAKDTGDAFNELNSLGNLARLAFVISIGQFPQIDDIEHYYRRDFRHRYPTLQFTILEGLLYTYLGHLALKQLDVERAENLYRRGMPLLSQVGTYAFFNLQGQLTFIETEIIPHLSPQLTRNLGEDLKKWWLSNQSDVNIALAYFQRWATKGNLKEVDNV